MSFGYTRIDGERVEVHVAAAFGAMNKQFEADTGCRLVITSGTRTDAEQWELYNGWINRLPGYNLAAKPPNSNHQENGPSGPRSLDLADTGSDWGVSRRGTPRDKWMERNAGRWEFENEGYNFNPIEAWHKTFRGVIGGTTNAPSVPISEKVLREQQFLNIVFKAGLIEDGDKGPATTEWYKKYQIFLNDNGYADKAIGRKLVVDGDWGDNTQAAHALYYVVWEAEQIKNPTAPAFPLSSGQYFGPEAAGDNSISGWHNDPLGHPGLKQWQQRMKDRGWTITADGLYGQKGDTEPKGETASIAKAFQLEKGLKPDGEIGPITWDAAWTAPITSPTNPTPLPETPPAPKPVDELPKLVTPTAADFPSWIKYEEKFDKQWLEKKDTWNAELDKYYNVPYQPIESHTHWWGKPDGSAGTHDGNVDYLNRTPDVGANYVTSPGRITLTMPLDQNALTTGKGNPRAWKSENDPVITIPGNDLGYKTLGYLHYIVEKLNPRLKGEAIRLHKEVLPGTTSCSEINTSAVRNYANQFASGALDPATGLPPKVQPPVTPPVVIPDGYKLVEVSWLENLRENQLSDGAAIAEVLAK